MHAVVAVVIMACSIGMERDSQGVCWIERENSKHGELRDMAAVRQVVMAVAEGKLMHEKGAADARRGVSAALIAG